MNFAIFFRPCQSKCESATTMRTFRDGTDPPWITSILAPPKGQLMKATKAMDTKTSVVYLQRQELAVNGIGYEILCTNPFRPGSLVREVVG